jgi:hypothetical protein
MAEATRRWDEEWENVAVKRIDELKAKREALFKATKAFQTAQKDVNPLYCSFRIGVGCDVEIASILSARRLSKTRANF